MADPGSALVAVNVQIGNREAFESLGKAAQIAGELIRSNPRRPEFRALALHLDTLVAGLRCDADCLVSPALSDKLRDESERQQIAIAQGWAQTVRDKASQAGHPAYSEPRPAPAAPEPISLAGSQPEQPASQPHPCPTCKGTEVITLLTSQEPCPDCQPSTPTAQPHDCQATADVVQGSGRPEPTGTFTPVQDGYADKSGSGPKTPQFADFTAD